jgi:hypothetical protein
MKIIFIGIILTILIFPVFGDTSSEDVSCFHCHPMQVQEFVKSAHFNNISCTDCHGGSANISNVISINAMANITSISKENMTNICSNCHLNESKQYKQSIHWNQFEKGVTIAATCTDCHSNHDIQSSKEHNSSTNPSNVPLLCAQCHENQTKMQAWYYGIKTDRYDTYKNSFHYKALLLGNKGVATCQDCHENHDTRNQSDPLSTIYPANLKDTCGKQGCHPREDVLIIGKVHEGTSINFYNIDVKKLITYFYLVMIAFELIFTLGLISLSISSQYSITKRE